VRIAILILVSCGASNSTPKCIEGASVACACASGSAGAQVCTAAGTYAACACTPAVVAVPGAALVERCALDVQACAAFASQDREGWKLHELVVAARTAKRYREAICLAHRSASSNDAVLVGASHSESSQAWEALDCHAQAVSEIEASIAARPYGRSGWSETCEVCAQLKAACTRCTEKHEIAEDDLVGKWAGTEITNMRIPADHAAQTPASEKIVTAATAVEFARSNGRLVVTGREAVPLALSRAPHGELVDRSEEDVKVVTYALQSDQLRIETEIKGHSGGTTIATLHRVSN